MAKGPVTVAIVNTNPDLVRLLRFALERAGFVCFEYHIESIRTGEADVESLLRQHDPKVIVYDLAPPYEMNWQFLEHLRNATGFKGRHFVLTAVNERAARDIVELDESVYEVVGHEKDIAAVVRAVKMASRARSTR